MTGAADRSVGIPTPLAGHPAVFEPGDPPRTGSITFWVPDGGDVPDGPGDAVRLTVAAPTARDTGTAHDSRTGDHSRTAGGAGAGGPVRQHTVPAQRVPIADAIPLLLAGAAGAGAAHPAVAFWALATRLALHLAARQRLAPTVSPAGFDAWRIGPLRPDDLAQIRRLAAAIPPMARAVPVPGTDPPHLPDAWPLLRGYLDAVADTLPRTPAAASGAGAELFAATAPQPVPGPRGWAEEITAELDAAVRISLRLETTDDPVEGAGLRGVLQVHSMTDPARVADARTLWADTPGPAAGFGTRARIETALAVRRAARIWPPLTPLLDETVPDTLPLTDQEIGELLDGAAARLGAAGVEVHWPRDLAPTMTVRAVLTGGPPPAGGPPLLEQGWPLRLDWQLTLGGDPLTPAEMDLLAEAHRPVVRLRDRWTLVEPDLARRARDRSLKPLTPLDALGVALAGSTEVGGELVPVAVTGWVAELRERLARPDAGPEPLAAPAGLNATLRDYQLRGVRWLARMTALGLGGCLADDMGLGKTVTLIALHLRRQSDPDTAGPTLVVCPASLLGNWQREIERFAPGVAVSRFHGSARSIQPAPNGFLLTTYATMRLDAARLAETRWGLLVADEAQHVKNPTSGTARALRRIDAAARVALTGTPVENNLSELWAILDWTTPGLLGPPGTFRRRWADPVQGGDPAAAQRLARLIAPFLLRRRKSDPGVAPELPAKTETDHPVPLTAEQAGLYAAVSREIMAEIRAAGGMARRGLVLKLLTALKQICNHPAQYLREAEPRLAGRSGKLELLDELLDSIRAADGAVLIFTQYVAMARLLRRHLDDRGHPNQLLHGGTPVARREELVGDFQAGAVPIFLLSLKAAGTGLNLTRADHVVHYDRWWNPAVEQQATDRAHRIGQTRPVQVHRLIAEGTIEDRIASLLAAKRDLADAVLTGGEAALTELSDAELAELVELRSRR